MGSWIVYVICFLSGTAALMYEIVWFRSLSLVFGGSHLAVTTTVAVFMAGLALGNWLAARYMGRVTNLMRFNGLLELGIAGFGAAFFVLLAVYPHVYAVLAEVAPASWWYLTVIRTLFAILAMAAPTTLMGATLPVLTTVLAETAESVGSRLSLLYGLNTLGGIIGVVLAGFVLIPVLPVSRITYLAMTLNLIAGAASFILARRALAPASREDPEPRLAAASPRRARRRRQGAAPARPLDLSARATPSLSDRLVLWGVGVSGFCALGYEILWTRILILFTDASVYSFTVVLASFLAGISLGGLSYGVFRRIAGSKAGAGLEQVGRESVGFGLIQLGIGAVTIVLMHRIFDLPLRANHLIAYAHRMTGGVFSARQIGNFALASSWLFVPAFLMGLAVPIAGQVHARYTSKTGAAVGEVITFNTIGAILGAALTGFVLIYLAGIERSLELLALVNIGLGALVIAGTVTRKPVALAGTLAVFAVAGFLVRDTPLLRTWDPRYLATYTHNQASLYADRGAVRKLLEVKEVLYYGEGVESIVSSVRNRNTKLMSFTVNGRVEASTELEDIQNQYMLGHLPMLLHENPKTVLVVGAGSGMTLGAVSVHPGLESVTLAEIEPKVLGVVRSFGAWNHDVLENPKLSIVLNDGRNFLLTTDARYDVITADPIHPSWQGAGYLYTSEYFALAAGHLAEGGVMCQWLPLYQLSVEDLRSVVGTFGRHFKYVMAWLTIADVQLVGSNSPLLIDEEKLRARLSSPEIARDFRTAELGDVAGLYTYFLMGGANVTTFAGDAVINTDDNVYLEYSAPRSIGDNATAADCLRALLSRREGVEGYLVRRSGAETGGEGRGDLTSYGRYHASAAGAHVIALRRNLGVPADERERAMRGLLAVPDRGLWKSLRMLLAASARDGGEER